MRRPWVNLNEVLSIRAQEFDHVARLLARLQTSMKS